MFIPIPIGIKYKAAVQGAVWKFVSCTHCQNPYAYLLELEAIGEDIDVLFVDREGSRQQAQENAEQNLLQKARNCVLPIPCPSCGFYQPEMSRQLKDDAWTNPVQFAGAFFLLLSFTPFVIDIAYATVVTVVLAVLGATLLAYGYVRAYRFDPNAGDPEPRKALGQNYAVWGEQLVELLAANPNVERSAADNGHCGHGP